MSGFSITLDVTTAADRDRLIAELWDAGTTGITEEETWLRAFFDENAEADNLLQRFREYQPCIDPQDDRNWVEHAQSIWRAFEVGDRFWLAPEWDPDPAPANRLRLPIRPGLACGSGWHPATQLCLQALERTVTAEAFVLDVGTGSGILAEAARMLGARAVVGCDIEYSAAVIARENVPEVGFFAGSLRSVRSRSADVLVANLDAAALATLSADIPRVARSTVIVSGFREDETPRVEKMLERETKEILEMDGWVCLIS